MANKQDNKGDAEARIPQGDGMVTCLECGEPLADDCRFDTCGKHGRDQFVDTVMKGKG